MLEVRDIRAAYGRVEVLHGMNVTVPKAKVVALLGGNGAGKSTTMKCVAGLLRVSSGTITLDGERIENLPTHQIFRRGIAMSPQHRELFANMTVAENLELGSLARGDQRNKAQLRERVLDFFPRVRARLEQRAGSLSGGEQQMLATGRALMSEPKLLLLDEPTAGLAPVMIREIAAIIRELKNAGETILLVEQNVKVALRVADYIYVTRAGQVAVEGEASSFQDDEELFKQYVGQR
jgi:branched-chain amino acid transport system ATP-binding protein